MNRRTVQFTLNYDQVEALGAIIIKCMKDLAALPVSAERDREIAILGGIAMQVIPQIQQHVREDEQEFKALLN